MLQRSDPRYFWKIVPPPPMTATPPSMASPSENEENPGIHIDSDTGNPGMHNILDTGSDAIISHSESVIESYKDKLPTLPTNVTELMPNEGKTIIPEPPLFPYNRRKSSYNRFNSYSPLNPRARLTQILTTQIPSMPTQIQSNHEEIQINHDETALPQCDGLGDFMSYEGETLAVMKNKKTKGRRRK